MFLVSPSTLGSILLGSSIDGAVSLVVSRVAGVLLLSLGVACWLAHKDEKGRCGFMADSYPSQRHGALVH